MLSIPAPQKDDLIKIIEWYIKAFAPEDKRIIVEDIHYLKRFLDLLYTSNTDISIEKKFVPYIKDAIYEARKSPDECGLTSDSIESLWNWIWEAYYNR